MTGSWLDELNAPQRQAATHGGGPLLVIAGAGTGKTRTLAARVAHLVEQGVRPERILLLTFTRRAAAEMLHRAGALVGQAAVGKVWGGTFHAIANRLLRVYGRALGLGESFTVLNEGDAEDLFGLVRNELGHARTDRRFPRKQTLAAIYSRTVNAQAKLVDVLARQFPWCGEDQDGIREVFNLYARRKREQNLLDYDDLLLFWNLLCRTAPVGEVVADRFDHVLVDEYQDTNRLQAEILQGMRRRNRNLMVVGDDAQAIYSFRAATVRNILDFPQQFAGAAVVTLEQNYRSVQPILDASNAVMSAAAERYTKNLFSNRPSPQKPVLCTCMDEDEQTQLVCRHVLDRLENGIALRQQAVLFRTGYHSDMLEVELARRNIPFVKWGGLKFVEAAHVRDMLAFLRILDNPADELSWFRVLQLLEGIGPQTARKIMDQLGVQRRGAELPTPAPGAAAVEPEADAPLEGEAPVPAPGSPLQRLEQAPPAVPAPAREGFARLRQALLDAAAQRSPAVILERLRRFYEPVFEQRYDNPKLRLRDLEQLEQIARGYRSLTRFITDLALDPPRAASDLAGDPTLEEDYLILSTIHSAKGCEWDSVHLLHAADGMIPSDMALADPDGLEEERRLFYVAMTRARNHLFIYFPLRYYTQRRGVSDRHHYAQLTRFLTPASLALFERRATPQAERPEGAVPPAADPGAAAASIDAMLKQLWD